VNNGHTFRPLHNIISTYLQLTYKFFLSIKHIPRFIIDCRRVYLLDQYRACTLFMCIVYLQVSATVRWALHTYNSQMNNLSRSHLRKIYFPPHVQQYKNTMIVYYIHLFWWIIVISFITASGQPPLRYCCTYILYCIIQFSLSHS